MLNAVILSAVMLSVINGSVVMLIVVAPSHLTLGKDFATFNQLTNLINLFFFVTYNEAR